MSQNDMSAARKAMIDSQLRTSGVNERFVLARMANVAREEFVPAEAQSVAYMDRAIPLGEGRFLPSPLFHGMMLTEAAPAKSDSALVIENGASYLSELMRPLVHSIDSIDVEKALAQKSARKKYTLIMIDGAIEELPASLAKRLEDDGRIITGRVVRGVTRLAIGRKVAGKVAFQSLAEIGIPVLSQFDKPESWTF